jgi:hypothetical protein
MLNWFFKKDPLVVEISLLRGEIKNLAMSFRQPPVLFVSLIRKENSSMALVYSVSAGLSSAKDVVTRELAVAVNGVSVGDPVSYPGDTTSFGEVKAEQGDEVTLTLVDIDDATPPNRSEPAVVTFTAKDTIAPPQPGEFGVTLVREEA